MYFIEFRSSRKQELISDYLITMCLFLNDNKYGTIV